nr:arginine-glutamic acid dipeptide repeats protein-like isoform X2 [Megalopta genalis]
MGNRKNRRNSSKKSPRKNTVEFYKQRAAVIPECRDKSEALVEYGEQDEPIWKPPAEVHLWYSLYTRHARFLLCETQCQKGISFNEALENSASGMADQYFSDCLHQNRYKPLTTLAHMKKHGPPQTLTAKWSTNDRKLFAAGYVVHGKDFASLRKQYLPEKTRGEIVVYYYKWKRTAEGKELNRQRVLTENQKPKRNNRVKAATPERTVEPIPEFPASTRRFTRSAAAEQRAAIAAAQDAVDGGASTSAKEV